VNVTNALLLPAASIVSAEVLTASAVDVAADYAEQASPSAIIKPQKQRERKFHGSSSVFSYFEIRRRL
jgi:hypothetical protein